MFNSTIDNLSIGSKVAENKQKITSAMDTFEQRTMDYLDRER